ncbi:hypothetical protein TTHERM_00268139 (macronuclear) [Tetrahymena thermophila SB210]|uniref:Uncharacterized protein n=1 Tax=Tetrahymena thermophila (strain SB210) TaxID=312017 RepID=A4VDW5_TETTS|nr:hypothetical protein TTHERM_00268139 [Tetrahymena thermophila SB210]EDK31727.1 hypothetical protein TTHERM_00268139 [Tetrahymena thermophila SB210]|eukprot:XP_001470791.1 hypothetical protein TTHERM_00268139 [Tetrahymena thermophila SB210]
MQLCTQVIHFSSSTIILGNSLSLKNISQSSFFFIRNNVKRIMQRNDINRLYDSQINVKIKCVDKFSYKIVSQIVLDKSQASLLQFAQSLSDQYFAIINMNSISLLNIIKAIAKILDLQWGLRNYEAILQQNYQQLYYMKLSISQSY